MKIYDDPELKKLIQTIHFGKVEAGSSKTITLYLLNDSKAVLTNLVYEFPSLPSSETLEVHGPITIQSGKQGELILTWKPSVNFKRALVLDLLIRAEEVYLAEENIS